MIFIIILGIQGTSGSGKTTLAKMIKNFDEKNIEIIHLDHLLDYLKKKVFRNKATVIENTNSEELIVIEENTRDRFWKNKIGLFFRKNKRALLNFILKMKIIKAKMSGKKTIIIEGFNLGEFTIAQKCNAVIVIKSNYIKRIERTQARDKSIKSDMVYRDRLYRLNKFVKNIKYEINNNGGFEELEMHAKEIYMQEINPKYQEECDQESAIPSFRDSLKGKFSSIYPKNSNDPKHGENVK